MTTPLDSLVVTVVGPDRPGLVRMLSDRGRAHGASWEESRMATLAGQFAGIIHFVVPGENATALTFALQELESSGLNVMVVAGNPVAPIASGSRTLALELVGQDRPGIVRDISKALADLGISIQELETELSSAAMSGEHLFTARAVLAVPREVAPAKLRGVLEALANELMVDVELDEASGR